MKLFLDTSSLFKLYHEEAGSEELERSFSVAKITHIFLSEIAKVEFVSTIWKKVRIKEISQEQGQAILELFETDSVKYNFITADSLLVESAKDLIAKYGVDGLRTLDSLQLATAVSLSETVSVFLTADKLLETLIHREGLNTDLPR